MTVCNFFLQGRCRYGDKCWNEHPRGGGGSGSRGGGGGYGNNQNSRPPPQQQQTSNRGGGGGFGNRVWVNPAQRSGGNYVQPSSFASDDGGKDWGRGGGGSDWGRGGGGGGGGTEWSQGGRASGRGNTKSSEFNFSTQNRFSNLSTPSTFDKGGRGAGGLEDENEKHLDTIQKDMEIWESSGQWVFSCYSVLKATISGFTDLSPEELRMEYYNNRASGDLQGYANGIGQLVSQWRNRVQELKAMSAPTRVAMLAELENPAPQVSSGNFVPAAVSGFGTTSGGFGTADFGAPAADAAQVQASSFSFTTPSTGLTSTVVPSAASGFGNAAPTQPSSGFGPSTSTPQASGFSFAAPAASKAPTSAFEGSASGFSFSSTANAGGGFGSSSGSVFGLSSGGFGTSGAVAGSGSAGGTADNQFTPQNELSPDELNEFAAKRFTLGQIPLRPPPVDMLVV